jgi:hypothetical protein
VYSKPSSKAGNKFPQNGAFREFAMDGLNTVRDLWGYGNEAVERKDYKCTVMMLIYEKSVI